MNKRAGVIFSIEWKHNEERVSKVNVSEPGMNSTVVSLNIQEIKGFAFRSNVSNVPYVTSIMVIDLLCYY